MSRSDTPSTPFDHQSSPITPIVTDRTFAKIFEASPALVLILSPKLELLAVTEAYLNGTMTVREEILGRHLFDVFPDNPDDPNATGVANLRRSLETVLSTRKPHVMAIQRYDIRKPDDAGTFEVRYWRPINTPVLNESGEVEVIMHRVEDVTEFVLLQQSEADRNIETKRLQAIIEAMPDGVIVTNADDTVILVNAQAESMFGYSRFELVGRPFAYIVQPTMQKSDGICIGPREGETEKWSSDTWSSFRRKDGAEFPGHIAVSHVVEEYGVVTIYAVREMSALHQAQQVIQRANERYHDVLDNMFEAAQILSFDWRYVYLNDAAVRNSHMEREALIGFRVMDCFPGIEYTEMFRVMSECMETRIVKIQDFEFTYPDGTVTWYSFSLQPVPEGLFILSLEISDRKRTEEEATRLNSALDSMVSKRTRELEEAIAELESFSYSVSHDLRAPLRHVMGYVGMLRKATVGQLDGDAQRYLQIIDSASREMGQLIDDLLAFSRMGRGEFRSQLVSLDRVVGDVVFAFQADYGEREIEWSVNPLGVVVGDPAMLKVAFINLIGNAVKYTKNCPHAKIEIGLVDSEPNELTVRVRDNGAGFDMQYADKLFGVFQRLHRSDEFEGTGIGLAIVRRIINRHGGRTWAEGTVNHGASFYLTLPTEAIDEARNE